MPYFTNRGIIPLPSAAAAIEWDTGNKTANISLTGTPKLVATATATTVSGDGTIATSGGFHTSGKYYWEVTITTDSAGTGSGNVGVGVVNAAFVIGSIFVGGDTLSLCYYKDGNFYNNSSSIGSGAIYTTGAVISVALDLTNNRLWFQKDLLGWKGATGGVGDPATNSNGINIATLASGGAGPVVDFETLQNGSVLTANFGATPYFALVPFGFINLDGTDPTKQVLDPDTSTGALTAGVTLDSTRLIATASGSASAGDHARGYLSRTSGKIYWEVTVTSAGTGTPLFGTALVDEIFTGLAGVDTHSLLYFNDGNVYFNSAIVATSGTLTTGDVMKIAIDLDASPQRLWVQKNSAGWRGPAGSGDPATPSTGIDISAMGSTFYPLIEIRNPDGIFTANFLTGAPGGYGYWV